MTAIEPLLQTPAARALAWALLHFIWQGTLVALAAGAALLALRRSAADVRYIVAAIGLTLMLTLPVVTAVQRWQTLRVDADTGSQVPPPSTPPHAQVRSDVRGDDVRSPFAAAPAGTPAFSERLPRLDSRRLERVMPGLLLVWLSGVAILSIRLIAGCLWIRRLRVRGLAPAAEALSRVAARLAGQMHIRRSIALSESALVDVPTVIGWVKPMVLLPVSALSALSPQQLEAILAHELAHIRRHDYLVNMLQTLVETLLFYHPAVWWLSRRIRAERENCCDDLAVSLCGDPVAYAGALADLETLRGSDASRARERALTPTLAATGGSLLNRVRRLVGMPASHAGQGPVWLAASAALVLLFGIAIAADGLRQTPAAAPARIASTPVSRAAAEPASSTPAVAGAAPRQQEAAAPASTPTLAQVDGALAALERARDEAMRAQAAVDGEQRSRPMAAAEAMRAEAGELNARASAMAQPTTPALAGADVALAETNRAIAAAHVAATPAQGEPTGNGVWTTNGEKLEVSYAGRFEFTDDDSDVRVVSPGGHIRIADSGASGRHAVEIRERDGGIERKYYVNGSERPFEPEGRQWLRENLPKLIQNSGLDADRRVARILKSGGPEAVLAEISRIDGSYVKRVYFTELFKQATLSGEQYRQAMLQASREMKSDYDLASLLISIADRLPADDASRAAYFTAAAGIRSDYEIERVYSTMLKRGSVGPGVLAAILERAGSIGSDYQLSELLRQIVAQQTLDDRTRPPFFTAVDRIGSPYDRGRVLQALAKRDGTSRDTILAVVNAAARIPSSYDRAQVLLAVAASKVSLTGDLRDAYINAADSLHAYEQGQVMTALVRNERAK